MDMPEALRRACLIVGLACMHSALHVCTTLSILPTAMQQQCAQYMLAHLSTGAAMSQSIACRFIVPVSRETRLGPHGPYLLQQATLQS